MPLPMRSRFTYGDAGVFECSITTRPWTPGDSTVGGVRVSAAGVPASYIVRRDATMKLTLRITEEEYDDLLAFIAFGQSAEPFLWFPDAVEITSFLVYLDAPAAGTEWSPTRESFQRVFEQAITLRGVGAVIPWLRYFPAD